MGNGRIKKINVEELGKLNGRRWKGLSKEEIDEVD